MSTRIVNAQEVDLETPKTTPDPNAPAKKQYKYQPKDAQGNKLGGEQVIEYETDQELIDKLATQNADLVRLNRELKWKADRPSPEDVPADAERHVEEPEAAPAPLDAAERLRLSREIIDPEKMPAAAARLFEAIFGFKPKDLKQVKDNMQALRARAEAQAFAEATPDFYRCQDNVEKVLSWCQTRKLAFVKANFELAYKKLKEAGLLLEAPIAAEETRANTQPDAETTESRIAPSEVTQPPRRPESTSSGLTRSNTSSAGGAPGRRGLTWADLDRMPFAEYEKKYRTDQNFRRQVDALGPRK